MKQNEEFIAKAFNKAIVPCMLSILSGNINILIDGIVVGQKIGINGLAALNLCFPIYLILCVIGSVIVSGTGIMSTKEIGRNHGDKAMIYYQLSIGLCLVASIAVTAVGLAGWKWISVLLCPDETLLQMVKIYGGVILAGSVANIMIYIPFWYLRIDGRYKAATLVMVVMAVSNLLLDLLLVVVFPFGVFGAAVATVISTVSACAFGFYLLCDQQSSFHFGCRVRCDYATLWNLFKYGSPAALNNGMQTLRILFINSLLMKMGGNMALAMFSAINCMSEFSLCILSGVPQAANAMLGIFYGELDAGSVRLLMQRQWKVGMRLCLAFGAAIVLCANGIADLYGLNVSLTLPLLCLAFSLLPGLLNTILIGYYSVSGYFICANALVTLRVWIMAVVPLYLLGKWNLYPWLFMICAEIGTLGLWWFFSMLYHNRHQETSRYLFLNDHFERDGSVLNFSVDGTAESICEASEKISDFCLENGMNANQVMKIQLSLEEIMMKIVHKNKQQAVKFDVRAFAMMEVRGIRIRYDGEVLNPFILSNEEKEDPDNIGVRLIEELSDNIIYQRTFGVNTVQILI